MKIQLKQFMNHLVYFYHLIIIIIYIYIFSDKNLINTVDNLIKAKKSGKIDHQPTS